MGSKENVSMVIMEKDKAKVVALNGSPDRLKNKHNIHGNSVGVAVEVLPVQEKLVSVSII